MKRIIALVCSVVFALPVYAEEANPDLSPVGKWRTIDDSSGKPKGMVQLEMVGSDLEGRVLASYSPAGADMDPICTKCEGERKNKKVIGMTFLWGMSKDGEYWRGGEILDPDTGDIYDAKLRVVDGGRKLEVRGFLGISLLGRSQIWERIDAANP